MLPQIGAVERGNPKLDYSVFGFAPLASAALLLAIDKDLRN